MSENINQFQPKVKCATCYQIEWCMLLPSQRKLCLGPFKDIEDSIEKIRADNRAAEVAVEMEREKGLEKMRRLSRVDEYREKKMLLEMALEKGQTDDDD